jgi:hypothetical protein
MPIVSGYTLALYCDNSQYSEYTSYEDIGDHEYGSFPQEYVGEFGSKCREKARKEGWKLDLKSGKAYCPKCVENGLIN